MGQSPCAQEASADSSVSPLPLQAHVCMCGCAHACTHTACPRGLCDMLCLIFIPSLQSASPQGASVSLSPPPALAVLSVFHILQNEQLPRSGLLLSGLLEGCQPPDLTRVPIPGQLLGDQGKGEHSSVCLLWLLGSRMGRLPNPERPEGYSQKPRGG